MKINIYNLQSALRLREANFAYNLSRIRFLPNENISAVRYSVRMSVSVLAVQAKIKKGEESKGGMEEGKCWNSNGDSFGAQVTQGFRGSLGTSRSRLHLGAA